MIGELTAPTSRVTVSDHCAVLSETCSSLEIVGISCAPSELIIAVTIVV